MTDFSTYDLQKAKWLSNSSSMNLPLLSWDVHLENLYTLSILYKDLQNIKQLTDHMNVAVDIASELKDNGKVIVITDANLNIEFASANMFGMSGYLPSEMIGNTPKMLQGPETDKALSKKIRAHVNNCEPFEGVLANYKKNKSVYNCHIKGYPIFNKKGELVRYVAVEQAA